MIYIYIYLILYIYELQAVLQTYLEGHSLLPTGPERQSLVQSVRPS